jgi:glutathione synthase/RimK-type ligase-like ATP-grasp enzyme
MKKIYVWYSGATDITGKNLVEGLTEKLDNNEFKVTGGTSKPTNEMDLVIGYGTKTSRDIPSNSLDSVVLNHPNAIRVNRNKLAALQKMEQNNVQIAQFESISKAISPDSNLVYPIIARTNYHQGGRGLAICASLKQLKQLIRISSVNFGYAQELLTIDKEYRIHIFKDKVIRIAEKVIQENPIQSYCANYFDKITKAAERNEVDLNDETIQLCLKIISKDLTLPDFLVRSNKHGWGFKKIDLGSISQSLQEEAKAAVKAIGLDFGAVDCVITDDDEIDIIEVNTGPGLQGGTLTIYIDNIAEYIVGLWLNRRVTTGRTAAGARIPNAPSRNSMQEEINNLLEDIRTLSRKAESLSARS